MFARCPNLCREVKNLEEQDEKIGIVIRIHSNYYYVDCEDIVWECMLRNKLKKEGVEPKVGDKVAISEFKIVTEDDVLKNHCAVITKILARKISVRIVAG